MDRLTLEYLDRGSLVAVQKSVDFVEQHEAPLGLLRAVVSEVGAEDVKEAHAAWTSHLGRRRLCGGRR